MKTLVTIGCLLVYLLSIAACGEDDQSAEKTPVSIAFAPSAMQGEEPYTLTVAVTGPLMEKIEAKTSFTGKYASVNLDVPSGSNRTFTVKITDKNKILLYTGETTQSLIPGKQTTVSIPIIIQTEMVLIPAGEFSMGDHFNEGDGDEKPVHTVYLDAFYMDKYEVTVGQYKKFIKETGHRAPDWSRVSQYSPTDNHPIIYVTWDDAQAYCKWAGKRLPTEAEWEKAARGGLVGKRYPWGDEIDSTKANYDGKVGKTTPVGTYPENGYGLHDMAGNVWEWCADWYDGDYYSSSPRNNPPGTASGSSRVVRGGSWLNGSDYVRAAHRDRIKPTYMSFNIGFRSCVSQDVTP